MSSVKKIVYGESELSLAMIWAADMAQRAIKAGPIVITLSRQKRSLEQNSKLWACLTDLSHQVDWYGQKLSPEDWKDVMTAALKKQRVVPGAEGGFVALGARTSEMSKEELSDLIELILAFGAEQGVTFNETP